MAEKVTDEDLQLLGDLGVSGEVAQTGSRSAREQRIIAGFEEIERFVQENGRLPEHGENRDIFERLYAARLDRIRGSSECREVLRDLDSRGLLGTGENIESSRVKEELSDHELLATLGVNVATEDDVRQLVHVRSREEISAAEEI